MTRIRRALWCFMPLTTQIRGSKYEVEIPKLPFLREQGAANVQGMGSIALARLERRLGVLPKDLMAEIKTAIRFALELE
jgi:mRNA interferase MazF